MHLYLLICDFKNNFRNLPYLFLEIIRDGNIIVAFALSNLSHRSYNNTTLVFQHRNTVTSESQFEFQYLFV